MTPQSPFMIIAPVRDGAVEALRQALAALNLPGRPGLADPAHPDLPLGSLANLHFARALILDDPTLGDRLAYPEVRWPAERVSFALLGVCDFDARTLLRELVARARPGLDRLFGHCEGWSADGDAEAWLRDRLVEPAAHYSNRPGRTVVEIGEEAALHALLRRHAAGLDMAGPAATAAALKARVAADAPALTPSTTALPSQAGLDLLSLISLPLFFLVALLWLPLLWWLLIPLAAAAAWRLRHEERAEPVIAPPLDAAAIDARAAFEDHDVGNAFAAIGTLKPGRFRRTITVAMLWLANWTMRHVYNRGRLGRIGTVHFARWVLLDQGRRLLFVSDHDGPVASYLDDFAARAAIGLNAVFSGGIGYPRTEWLLRGGAEDGAAFERYLRHHQIVTQLWYKAYPGLTVADLERNTRLRRGYQATLDDAAARDWLAAI